MREREREGGRGRERGRERWREREGASGEGGEGGEGEGGEGEGGEGASCALICGRGNPSALKLSKFTLNWFSKPWLILKLDS
jgi:hypothetical protein